MPRIVSEMVHLFLSKSGASKSFFFCTVNVCFFLLFKQCCTFEIFVSDPSKIIFFVGLFLAETTRWWWATYLHSRSFGKRRIIILASYHLDGDTVEVAGGRGPNSDQEVVWQTFLDQLHILLAQHN